MNTREAIEFLTDHYPVETGVYSYKEKSKRKNDIIKLLQRGEKYKAMWGELENEGKSYSYSYTATTKFLMNNIKQKYFPKPIKKTITIEIEGDSEELIEANYSIIEDYLNNYKKNSSSASILKFTITEGGSQ